MIVLGGLILSTKRHKPKAFQPDIQAMGRNAKSGGNLCHALASIRNLTDRLNLEFFRISFAAHKHLPDRHFVRLKGV